ncbi:hypothetical protein H5410_015556 [Solanum commersonii]|uniref:Uncharacterized protein n=1 Tax=Solanum commersonii TaxID=4109 RepID=A0A9J5ZUS5_SOLCO|nr:hypothetical protein H5410_015556 [Solanum commersonii]
MGFYSFHQSQNVKSDICSNQDFESSIGFGVKGTSNSCLDGSIEFGASRIIIFIYASPPCSCYFVDCWAAPVGPVVGTHVNPPGVYIDSDHGLDSAFLPRKNLDDSANWDHRSSHSSDDLLHVVHFLQNLQNSSLHHIPENKLFKLVRERDGIGNESMDSEKLRSYILFSLKGIPFFVHFTRKQQGKGLRSSLTT